MRLATQFSPVPQTKIGKKAHNLRKSSQEVLAGVSGWLLFNNNCFYLSYISVRNHKVYFVYYFIVFITWSFI